MTDPIADMFIRIKNAQAVNHETVLIPASKVKENIARVLTENGYIVKWSRIAGKPNDMIEVELKYNDKQPVINHLKSVSRPGARRYRGVGFLPRPLSGHGLVIMSTPKGIMSGAQAEKLGMGGEVLATVW